MTATILVIEDDPKAARLLAETLRDTPDSFNVVTVASACAGLQYLANDIVDCVLLDYHLTHSDGASRLQEIRHGYPDVPVIVIAGTREEVITADVVKLGANVCVVEHGKHLLSLPSLVREALSQRHRIPNAAFRRSVSPASQETGKTRREAVGREALHGIIGTSQSIADIHCLIEQCAASDATVLIEGETGTGKELVATAIHRASARKRGPFLPVNCASIPEALLENELFGHARGAFTGADRDQPGLLKAAEGGILFLDEIGELPLGLQPKLLRVLDSGGYRPLGKTVGVKADARVVAATNRNLYQLVREGRFRPDLYFRLHVLSIRIPPLRERVEDIPLLVELFLDRHTRGHHPQVTSAAMAQLIAAPWPGNVRELEYVVQRTVLRNGAGPIRRFDLGATVSEPVAQAAPMRDRLVELLVRHRGHLRPVAEALGVSVRTVQRRMADYGLLRQAFRNLRTY